MELPQVITNLMTQHKGQIVHMTLNRAIKVRKSAGPVNVRKISTCYGRVGVNYDNQKDVVAKRETGELPTENAGLPWGNWAVFPYVIEHKGAFYFRFATVKNNDCALPEARYFLNGDEVSAETVKSLTLASEWTDKADLDTFSVNVSNIQEINGKPVHAPTDVQVQGA